MTSAEINQALYKELSAGASKEQKDVLKYFLNQGGCCGGGIKEEEYIRQVKERAARETSKKMAMSKLGIDEDEVNEIEPVTFVGWTFKNALGKKRANGEWISTSYQVSWLFFSAEQVYFYQYTFSMIEDKKSHTTNEYFYRDITSFSSKTESEKTKNSDEIESSKFTIVVPGDYLSIAVANTDDEFESTVRGLKSMLRDKKSVMN